MYLFFLLFQFISCNQKDVIAEEVDFSKNNHLSKRVDSIKEFAIKNGYNQELAVLIDMAMFSGEKRLSIWDLSEGRVIDTGLVSHGHCKKQLIKVEFSNVEGSNCSSDGKYAIGEKYTGKFGTSFKLIGLDSSNDNAFSRYIVLHSHSCVPDEGSLLPICLSEGCPTVSPLMLQKLEGIIDNSEKPILIWVFKSTESWAG
jgi:hypothetical protein